jgi:hypothetical protein
LAQTLPLLALVSASCTDHFLSDDDRIGRALSSADADPSSADAADTSLGQQRYPFVRIFDTSPHITRNPGTDLDAVSITKPSGQVLWAARVEDYQPAQLDMLPAETMIVDNVLGEPEAFGFPFDPANVGPDKPCSLDEIYFLGLGGPGGYVVLSFGIGSAVEAGDVISVYEIGGCSNVNNDNGFIDTFNVQVALASAPDAEWRTLYAYTGGDIGPLIRVTVP